jgi:tRNA threonylcarbamoyladenosine biosynthesis protein TsaE
VGALYNDRCIIGAIIVPILREGELDIISHNAEQTRRLGVKLGTLLQPGDVLCLSGELGAGKTVFSAGIGAGWGASEPLISPTFNLVHLHTREGDGARLYHLDCYRLSGAGEVDTIDLDDILQARGVVVIEWAERIESALPPERLWIELRVLELTRRNLVFTAAGDRYRRLVDQFSGRA